jgi:hypothetical protein
MDRQGNDGRNTNDGFNRQRHNSYHIKFCHYNVSLAPRYSRKRKEMCDILGNTDRDPTLDDLTRMERVIKETMTLFPVAPVPLRQVHEDIKIRKFFNAFNC